MATHLGLCTIDLHIPEATSLKGKRSVLKSMLEGIRSRFNVSAAELEHQDLWQRAGIGVACLSNDQAFCDRVLSQVVEWIEANPRVYVCKVDVEFL